MPARRLGAPRKMRVQDSSTQMRGAETDRGSLVSPLEKLSVCRHTLCFFSTFLKRPEWRNQDSHDVHDIICDRLTLVLGM